MEAIVSNLTKAIGWSILHSLWQGAIIYIVLFMVLVSWPKMTSRLKHNLSFAALLLIFTSFAITFLTLFDLPSTGSSRVELSQITYYDFIQFSKLSNFKTEAYFPVVVGIYLTGIVVQLIVLLSSYFKLKDLKQASTLAVPTEWNTIFKLTLSQLKINKTVKFYLSPKVNVPLVVGFLKPVVLFPVALATQLDIKQVEAILIHELSHIRRNDYLINLVKTCIETLLFFNPFVWLTTKFIHIEREHACDDLVVNFTGTPITYAHALLKLELLKDKNTPALSLAATGKNQHLYQRIKRITDMKTNYINFKQQFFILSLTIATIISLAWINPVKKPEETKTKKAASLTRLKEAKSLKKHLTLDVDTDSVKTKRSRTWVSKEDGKNVVYYSYDEMPDSVKAKFKAIDKKYNSPEFKAKIAKIEREGLEIEKKYNSPEFKAKIAKIEKEGLEIEKKYNSPEFKAKMAKIEREGLEIEKKYNSPEFKAKIAKIEREGLEIEKKYNSPEFKAKIAKIEREGLEIEKKYNSPEFKAKMAKIEREGLEIEKKYNSPEFKAKIAKIEKNGLELEKKLNSPEWKQKIKDIKKLQSTPEFKELQKRYNNDIQELKKKKGIKTDNSIIILENSNLGSLSSLFDEDFKGNFASTLPLKFKPIDFKFEDFSPVFEAISTPLATPIKAKTN
jgi:bla regulator protein BlaR1